MKTFKIQLVLNASEETMSADVNDRLGGILIAGGFEPVSSLVQAQNNDIVMITAPGLSDAVSVETLVDAYNRDREMTQLIRQEDIADDSFVGKVVHNIYNHLLDDPILDGSEPGVCLPKEVSVERERLLTDRIAMWNGQGRKGSE